MRKRLQEYVFGPAGPRRVGDGLSLVVSLAVFLIGVRYFGCPKEVAIWPSMGTLAACMLLSTALYTFNITWRR
jgi:hypothetical protein